MISKASDGKESFMWCKNKNKNSVNEGCCLKLIKTIKLYVFIVDPNLALFTFAVLVDDTFKYIPPLAANN